jgi:hypothetical protein
LGHPLLIPTIVARGWSFVGLDHPAIPIAIAALFTLGTVGLVGAAVAFARGTTQALLACSVLLGTPFFLKLGAWQVADLPLAFFFLAALVLLSLSNSYPGLQFRMVFLAGLCAGFAAWTKNEGLLFFVVTLGSIVLVSLLNKSEKDLKKIVCYVVGALPVLLIVWYFKTEIVPVFTSAVANPATSIATGPGIISRLGNLSRHFAILTAYQGAIRAFGEGPFSMPIILAFYFLVFGTAANFSIRPLLVGLLSWIVMFVGYYVVYILASSKMTFYSLDRILIQLWPSALFLFFMIVRTPEEALQGLAASRPLQHQSSDIVSTDRRYSQSAAR